MRLRLRHRFYKPVIERLEERSLPSTSAGFLDPTFGNTSTPGVSVAHFTGFTSIAVGAVEQPDGKIVAAGTATPLGGVPTPASFALARFNADGSLDTSFGTGGDVSTQIGTAAGMVLQSDGKIVVGGLSNAPSFTTLSGFAAARYNPDGSLDSSFGNGGTVTTMVNPKGDTAVTTVFLQPDGKIVLVGYHHESGPGIDFSTTELVRYNTDGSLDSSFGKGGTTGLTGTPGTAALQPDGTFIIPETSGTTFSFPFDRTWYVGRVHADGSVDSAFTPTIDFGRGDNQGLGVAIQADGKIVTSGYSAHSDLARANVDGTLDTTFGVNGKVLIPVAEFSRPVSLNRQNDGRILVASYANGQLGTGGLARYLLDGSLDTRFGLDGIASPDVGCGIGIALQSDGSILLTGSFPANGGSAGPDLAVARYMGGPSSALRGTANQRFVTQIYLDVLQRPVDPAGLAFWSGLLDSGQNTREQVVLGIEQSDEYQKLVVQNLYVLYFHRAADSGGITTWSSFLANGGTTGQLRAILLGSDEYARNHFGGNSSLSFLEGVYHDVLYRTIDSGGQTTWGQAQGNGASNEAIAGAIIRSTEGAGDEVQDFYHRLLHRAPDPTGLSTFTNALQNNVSDEVVLAMIAASDEYAAQL
jgi:uncharacterized delta-60 repeat protein